MPTSDTAIVLFAYKRPEHVRTVLEALVADEDSCKYHLIVFQDGPKSASEVSEIASTTSIIHTHLSKFASSEFKASNTNQGLAKSVITGLNYAFRSFSKCIIIEDDIVVGLGFIHYMQQLLDKHESNLEVGSVTGFQFISRNWRRRTNLYLSPRHSSWGWGTWRRVWESVNWDVVTDNSYEDAEYFKNLSRAGDDLLGMIELIKKKKIDSWSVIFDLNMIVLGLNCIHPVQQFCRNIGMDGTGTHYANPGYLNPYSRISAGQSYINGLAIARHSFWYNSQLRWKFSKYNIDFYSFFKITLRRIKRSS